MSPPRYVLTADSKPWHPSEKSSKQIRKLDALARLRDHWGNTVPPLNRQDRINNCYSVDGKTFRPLNIF